MYSAALKSRFWCPKCYSLKMPNETAVCDHCNTKMLAVELIVNRYVFHPKNRLGKGVVKVWDQRMRRWTAIKFPQNKKQYQDSAESSGTKFSRMDREIFIQATLEHPAIVSAYDVVEDPDYGKGLVMSLVEGLSLYKLVTKYGSLRIRSAVEIIRDITAAVQFMHKRGIIHRDLTPGNIIIKGKKPVLIDFGLAKQLGDTTYVDEVGYLKARSGDKMGGEMDITRQGEILGTPLFMAPEQVEGSPERIDYRSDIYGLGSTLYYIATGKPPFSGSDVLSVISQVLHRDPPPPSKANPNIDPPLEAIIQKAMNKEREKRFQTAEEFHDVLQKWLDGDDLPPEVYKTPASERISRRLAKMKKLLLIVFVLFGISLAGGSYLYLEYIQSRARKLAKDIKMDTQKVTETHGFGWGLEIFQRAKKQENYEGALALLEWMKKKWELTEDQKLKLERLKKETLPLLKSQQARQEKWNRGQAYFQEAEAVKKSNPKVALHLYLNALDNFKELYKTERKREVRQYMKKIFQRGEFLEKADTKLAFQFYLRLFNSLQASFEDSKDPFIQKKIKEFQERKVRLRKKLQEN